jgi:hypothetical protein
MTHGADIDARDKDGMTPLDLATSKKVECIVYRGCTVLILLHT